VVVCHAVDVETGFASCDQQTEKWFSETTVRASAAVHRASPCWIDVLPAAAALRFNPGFQGLNFNEFKTGACCKFAAKSFGSWYQ